ncbi:unnamed protein product, partial [Prorocentrum cordatum]
YHSETKAVSGASASVLVGAEVNTEDDVLALKVSQLPTFNDTLRPQESELLLTYLTAPYIRVPLLCGFFVDRDRISMLREPHLQAVLDSAFFEPGPWRSAEEASRGPPAEIPGPSREHLGTAAGVLLNELLHSPRVVLASVLSMLRVAVEKDSGRAGAENEGLILYLVRLAIRVESYLHMLITQAKSGTYLPGGECGFQARVRGLPSGGDDESLLSRLEADQACLRGELQNSVFRMLLNWSVY